MNQPKERTSRLRDLVEKIRTAEFGPSGKSRSQIQEEVMQQIATRGNLKRSYQEGNQTLTFCVKRVDPIFYPGIVDYNLHATIEVVSGAQTTRTEDVYLGSYVSGKAARASITGGDKYYGDTAEEITDMLVSIVNGPRG